MLLKRVKIENWRAIASREYHLKPGLNILRGPNEQGKSTVVEAIGKALYWDSTARSKGLDYIAPCANPTARPLVEVDLELDGLSLTITKVVSKESRHRQCVLQVRRPGAATERLENREAEERLKDLLSSHLSMAGIHRSEQSHPLTYLGNPLPTGISEALSLGNDGAILPSKRLERVRQAVDSERSAKLKKKLQPQVDNSTLAVSELHQLREQIAQKRASLTTATAELNSVEQLRRDVSRLTVEINALKPQVSVAKVNLDQRHDQFNLQASASRDLAEKRAQCEQQATELATFRQRLEEIGQLDHDVKSIESALVDDEKALAAAKQAQQAAANRRNDQVTRRTQTDALIASLRDQIGALECRQEMLHVEKANEQARRELGRSEDVQRTVAAAEAALQNVGSWPTGETIGDWRRMFAALDVLQHEAMTKLRVEVALTRPFTVEWSADGNVQPAIEAGPEMQQVFGAVRSLRLVIADIGAMNFSCGAKELDDLIHEIDAKRRELDGSLSAFGLTAEQLPEAFDQLEELRIRGETVQRTLRESRRDAEAIERELGSAAKVRARANQAQRHVTATQNAFELVRKLVPDSLDLIGVASELQRLKNAVAGHEEARRDAIRTLDAVNADAEAALEDATRFDTTLSRSRAELKTKRERLTTLLTDGLTAEQRSSQLDELQRLVAAAQHGVVVAEEQLNSLGPIVSESELQGLGKSLQDLTDRLVKMRQEVELKRVEIDVRCGEDVETEAQVLDSEIHVLEAKAAIEARKLEALILLHALLSAERQRIGRLLAEPLNQRIGPWLRQMRGVPTSVVINHETGCITHVVTERGGTREELPFAEHSEGLKGQIGLLIRLTLARLVAQQNGSHFVLLDDPISETSSDRRPEMFRVLQQAAQEVQVIFVTCHDDVLASIPGSYTALKV